MNKGGSYDQYGQNAISDLAVNDDVLYDLQRVINSTNSMKKYMDNQSDKQTGGKLEESLVDIPSDTITSESFSQYGGRKAKKKLK